MSVSERLRPNRALQPAARRASGAPVGLDGRLRASRAERRCVRQPMKRELDYTPFYTLIEKLSVEGLSDLASVLDDALKGGHR